MPFKTNLFSLISAIGGTVKPLLWLPDETTAPEDGAAYAPVFSGGVWIGWAKVPAPPPIDTFVPGWSFFGFDQIADLLSIGTAIAACSIGPETPTIAGITFEQSSANTGDLNVPTAGWSGTNWLIERADSAPVPPTVGINIGRLEVTAFNDLPDPTFGDIAGVQTLCESSLRRNSYITISGLTVGNRYYYYAFFGTYPNGLTRATRLEAIGGAAVSFGVDGVDDILSKGIRRYGFTATATSASFLKFGYDNSSSFQNGFACLDQGVA